MIAPNEHLGGSTATRKRGDRSVFDDHTKPVATVGPVDRPYFEVIPYATGGVACIVAPKKLNPAQIRIIEHLAKGFRPHLALPKKWGVWAVWSDFSYIAPEARPNAKIRLYFGC